VTGNLIRQGKGKWMRQTRWLCAAAAVAAAMLALGACGGDGDGGGGGGDSAAKDKVTLQSKWVVQAQFAGYYAALDQGFYDDENLDVTIKPGGPDIVPEQVVLGGQAEFGINWLDSLLATRDKGQDIVNVAQVFTRSGMTEITWKDSGLDSITDLRGKKVGVWLGGNEHKLFAALNKNGIDPQKDVEIVAQPFTMDLFLNREIDAAAAMTYNELAQVLETKDPKTGKLYTLDQLNVMKMSDLGTGALEDGVFVRGDWIQDEKNQDIAKRFLKASFRGWIYCRDNPEDCLRIVLDNGPTLGEGHQRWMLNEINALIWPAPQGIGIMDPESFKITNEIALSGKVIKKPATEDAYRTDLAEAAVEELRNEDVDVTGESWQKETVEVTEGGA
jgi:NitT/TauT family transport system substrate-binding protein